MTDQPIDWHKASRSDVLEWLAEHAAPIHEARVAPDDMSLNEKQAWREGFDAGMAYGIVVMERELESDVLEWLGWEKCEVCGGSQIRGGCTARGHERNPDHAHTLSHCEACLSGLVPPAHQVGAAARALTAGIFDESIDDIPAVQTKLARAALIAAMKAVSD